MDSAISTITEEGPIYRGVYCVGPRRARRSSMRHAALGCHRRRSVRLRQLPVDLGRNARDRGRRAPRQRDRSRHRGAGAGRQRDPRAYNRAPKAARWSARASCGWSPRHDRADPRRAAAPADRARLGARQADMPKTSSAARWCCSPITNSTPRPSRCAAPRRPAISTTR